MISLNMIRKRNKQRIAAAYDPVHTFIRDVRAEPASFWHWRESKNAILSGKAAKTKTPKDSPLCFYSLSLSGTLSQAFSSSSSSLLCLSLQQIPFNEHISVCLLAAHAHSSEIKHGPCSFKINMRKWYLNLGLIKRKKYHDQRWVLRRAVDSFSGSSVEWTLQP